MMSRKPRTDGGSTSNAPTEHQYNIPADEGLGGTILARPAWLLLLCSGVISTGLGATIVFVPPLVGMASLAPPNQTDILGVATVLVMTGGGLISGGLVAGLLRIGETVSERSRRHRTEGMCREPEHDTPK